MENVTLVFNGSDLTTTSETELICCYNCLNEISISLENNKENEYNFINISINKQTAVRLVRELKKQIGFIKIRDNKEGGNGTR